MTAAACNRDLAAQARDLATLAVTERRAALCLAACLDTTTSITAARKALSEIERADLRQRAGVILAKLVERSNTKLVERSNTK